MIIPKESFSEEPKYLLDMKCKNWQSWNLHEVKCPEVPNIYWMMTNFSYILYCVFEDKAVFAINFSHWNVIPSTQIPLEKVFSKGKLFIGKENAIILIKEVVYLFSIQQHFVIKKLSNKKKNVQTIVDRYNRVRIKLINFSSASRDANHKNCFYSREFLRDRMSSSWRNKYV